VSPIKPGLEKQKSVYASEAPEAPENRPKRRAKASPKASPEKNPGSSEAARKGRKRGAPKIHEDPVRVQVLLEQRHRDALDAMLAEIRKGSGYTSSVSELFRAFVEGVRISGLDLSAHPTEQMLAKHLAARLKG
jgi:hypothetical protein